jgi:hypothetical protein
VSVHQIHLSGGGFVGLEYRLRQNTRRVPQVSPLRPGILLVKANRVGLRSTGFTDCGKRLCTKGTAFSRAAPAWG